MSWGGIGYGGLCGCSFVMVVGRVGLVEVELAGSGVGWDGCRVGMVGWGLSLG